MSSSRPGGLSLIESLQRLIERTYDLRTGVTDIGRFLIGDDGFRCIYGALDEAGLIRDKVLQGGGGSPIASGASSGAARLLMRTRDEGLAVSLYLPDSLVACLERNDPTRGIDDGNVDAFNTLVEELDHFLVIADRWNTRGVVSLLDMELHANITKYLVLKMFVAKLRRTQRLASDDALWVRRQVFEAGEFVEPDPEVRSRYRDAARFGARYAAHLDAMPRTARLPELRRFHRMTPQEKVAHILAAA